MKDRRALARQKVDFNAKLIFVDAARALDCNVVDMTPDGARLELFAALELPERIYLWERRTNPIFECNVIGACRDALVCGSRIAAAETCDSPSLKRGRSPFLWRDGGTRVHTFGHAMATCAARQAGPHLRWKTDVMI